jgi:hypothetical protein
MPSAARRPAAPADMRGWYWPCDLLAAIQENVIPDMGPAQETVSLILAHRQLLRATAGVPPTITRAHPRYNGQHLRWPRCQPPEPATASPRRHCRDRRSHPFCHRRLKNGSGTVSVMGWSRRVRWARWRLYLPPVPRPQARGLVLFMAPGPGNVSFGPEAFIRGDFPGSMT